MNLTRSSIVLCVMLTSPAAVDADLGGFDCLIEPHAVVDVSTREDGVIAQVLVERGDRVETSQPIARLDADVEQAAVDLASARAQMQAVLDERKTHVEFTRRELARVDELLAKRAISARDKDQFETEAARARMQLRQAQQQQRVTQLELELAKRVLARRTIHSPISGVVVDRFLSAGESVENRAIMKIAQVNPLRVELIVPVEQFGAIGVGAKAQIVPKYPGAQPHAAMVTVVDGVVDAASNTFGVRLRLPNPGGAVPGGVRCDVHIER